jgi:drug/metabolite transporter (DMT)-like permease
MTGANPLKSGRSARHLLGGSGSIRVLLLAGLWGSNFLWMKVALSGFTPSEMVLARMVLAAALLSAVQMLRKGRFRHDLKTWVHLFILASFANVFPYFLFAVGERTVDSSVAGMLNATTPVWTVVLATVVGQEKRPGPGPLAGLGLGLAGTTLIFSPWRAGSQVMSIGGVACLLASLSFAVGYVYMAHCLAGRDMDPLTLSTGQLIASTVLAACVTPFLGFHEGPRPLSSFVAVGLLGIFGTGIACIVTYLIVSDGGATAASIVTYLVPAVAIVLGALVLGESPTTTGIVGVVIVTVGVALSRRTRAEHHEPN